MKRLLLFFLFIITFSCSKVDDDTRDTCTMNCTTLSGNFLTLNNQPLSGVEVTFSYTESDELSSYTRKIAKTKTNSKGEYNLNFYLKDKELTDPDYQGYGDRPGYFIISVNDKNLDSKKFIRLNNGLGYAIFSITNRDTIMKASFYIPKKTFLKINLKNFVPVLKDDYFEVQNYFTQGPETEKPNFLGAYYSWGSSGLQMNKATKVNEQFNVLAAAGEKNIVRITKRKNGVSSYEDVEIIIPENSSPELTYYY